MLIKTFRGLIEDGGQYKIHLSGGDPGTGYRINKFQLFPQKPGQETVENTIAIYKDKQTSLSTSAIVIDFGDDSLLGAGTFHEGHGDSVVTNDVTIFDHEVFNQSIYLIHTDTIGTVPVNFYLELEEIKMKNGEAAVVNFSAALLHAE